MSYEIMYNWQFLRSAEGLTPVVLMGSSNVTEASWSRANRRTERRARDWFCLFNMLGVTDDEFLAQIKSMTGGEYQEHWKQNANGSMMQPLFVGHSRMSKMPRALKMCFC